MMCMKTNDFSLNRRSNTGVEACAPDPSGGVPLAASSSGGGLGGSDLALHRSLSGDSQQPHVYNSGQKDPRGSLAPQEML